MKKKNLAQHFYAAVSGIGTVTKSGRTFLSSVYNRLSGRSRLRDERIKGWNGYDSLELERHHLDDDFGRALIGMIAGVLGLLAGVVPVIAFNFRDIDSMIPTLFASALFGMFVALQGHSLYQTGKLQSARLEKEAKSKAFLANHLT